MYTRTDSSVISDSRFNLTLNSLPYTFPATGFAPPGKVVRPEKFPALLLFSASMGWIDIVVISYQLMTVINMDVVMLCIIYIYTHCTIISRKPININFIQYHI